MKQPIIKKTVAKKNDGKKEACLFSFYGFNAICFMGSLDESLGETTFNYNNDFQVVIVLNDEANQRLAKATLMHELFEIAIKLNRCEYSCENGNNPKEFFMFGHNEMDMICEAVFSAYEIIVKYIDVYFKTKGTKK